MRSARLMYRWGSRVLTRVAVAWALSTVMASSAAVAESPPSVIPKPADPVANAPASLGCDTTGAADGVTGVRIAGDRLDVVFKAAGAERVCASVKLPATGKQAVLHRGVAYVSLVAGGLTIVDLADTAHPKVDRTVDSYRKIVRMRMMSNELETLGTDDDIVKYEFENLQPRKPPQQPPPQPPVVSSTAVTAIDSKLAGRRLILRDGSEVVGQLVELVPGERIRLLRSDGKRVSIPLSLVVRTEVGNTTELLRDLEQPSTPRLNAGQRMADQETMLVDFRANRPFDLTRIVSDERRIVIARGIQNRVLTLPISSTPYEISGDNVPLEKFRLPARTRVSVSVRVGSSEQQGGGSALLSLGAAMVVIGGLGLLGTEIASLNPDRSLKGYWAVSGTVCGLGAISVIIGPVISSRASTSVKVSSDNE